MWQMESADRHYCLRGLYFVCKYTTHSDIAHRTPDETKRQWHIHTRTFCYNFSISFFPMHFHCFHVFQFLKKIHKKGMYSKEKPDIALNVWYKKRLTQRIRSNSQYTPHKRAQKIFEDRWIETRHLEQNEMETKKKQRKKENMCDCWWMRKKGTKHLICV